MVFLSNSHLGQRREIFGGLLTQQLQGAGAAHFARWQGRRAPWRTQHSSKQLINYPLLGLFLSLVISSMLSMFH